MSNIFMILLLLITWMLFLPCLFFRIQRLKKTKRKCLICS
ncbi:hypothetical protein NC653_002902 [Populus alba x Populus x berolinensis]|uniref:Uncharacterized protein n=1 Tax=Populus alba x Populus x berolinensis TaxID=444605 RepID=A0AAD6RQ05_9ROSI|nr:hypothetical protein NC653_002902 [Populus alba x Populus x berolinensis]